MFTPEIKAALIVHRFEKFSKPLIIHDMMQLLVGPLLSIVHVYGVCEEMHKLLQ